MAAPRKTTPLSERPILGATDLKWLNEMIEALNDVGRGDLYMEKAVIQIWNGNGYPVGTLVMAKNDEEFNFVTWNSEHDDESN